MPTSQRGTIDMTERVKSPVARFVRAAFIQGIALTSLTTITEAGAQIAAAPGETSSAPANSMLPQSVKPRWSDLSQAQKQALAPLESEWDNLDSFRKNKWLVIGNKFASMKPDEQQRVQDRMREWVRLTPEQRRTARENYLRAQKLKPDQKSAQWEQYQQLPEDEKKKLAAEPAARKPVVTLPPPAQRKDSKTVPPIKSASKPVLEKSVTSQAASQSALQPSVPPNNK